MAGLPERTAGFAAEAASGFLAGNREIVAGLLVAAAAAALATAVPRLRSTGGRLALGLLAAAAFYRAALPGAALTLLAAHLLARGLARLPTEGREGGSRRWPAACAAMVALAAVFLAGRAFEIEAARVELLGAGWSGFYLDMWLFLRLETYLWEVGAARVAVPGLAPFLLWGSLPFTFVGPVLRFSELESQQPAAAAARPAAYLCERGWWGGLALAVGQLAAAALLGQAGAVIQAGPAPVAVRALAWFGTSPWGFYLTWAGYFGLMERLARGWGLALPPSFERPFGRPNVSAFWAHWNMTATSVFRDYLFYNRWGLGSSNLYLNAVIVFAAVGLWHGTNAYWLLWGLLHGLGFAAYLGWRRARAAMPALEPAARWLPGRLLTYLFVCSCWILPGKLLEILGAP